MSKIEIIFKKGLFEIMGEKLGYNTDNKKHAIEFISKEMDNLKANQENNMKTYTGVKFIKAKPMSRKEFEITYKDDYHASLKNAPPIDEPGYLIKHPNGYISWLPNHEFETDWREFTDGEKELFDDE